MITGSVVPKLFLYFLRNLTSVPVLRRHPRALKELGGKERWKWGLHGMVGAVDHCNYDGTTAVVVREMLLLNALVSASV